MASKFVIVFHVYGFFQSISALVLYHNFVETARPSKFGGPWRFLTYINMNIQAALFTLCVLTDVAYIINAKSIGFKLLKLRDNLFSAVAFPCCLMVFTTFWAIFLIDRELVYPAHLDKIIPVWMNHVMHTSILITVVELFCTKHLYPRRVYGITVSSLFGFAYLLWILYIHYMTGDWIYPILAELRGLSFVAFIAAQIIFQDLLYVMGEVLNRASGEYVEEKGSKKA
nr:androgen-induced gene 1 protein [Ciona intestinalis]|eukprot:XP_026696266.1 androgen-induced gene 1 protein [Ciona intestinalis]